ncbi:hypothetical protein N7450_006199 [Penicillium hetheringtonii]|uniref:Major facilitator superfamily (MFS) profile domain-containing protein n=1 Tax=Penicillium hetheringtonii TaxID=911720 RepID=A0AAD6DKK1_9EURO|nr:hypothetical protein N7450_006199 [Penicillium hetheringtonii]
MTLGKYHDDEEPEQVDITPPPSDDESDARGNGPESVGAMLRLTLWIAFAAWIFNFDHGYTGAILIMPSYKKAFGTCTTHLLNPSTGAIVEHCTITPIQQSLISLNYLFTGIGGGLSGVTGQYTGRRGGIQIGCILAIIGAAGMLGTGAGQTGSFTHYMVCKCISAIGLGQLSASSLTYSSECIVASKRGVSLGLYNIGLALGNVASSAVCAGSAQLEPHNNWQWKTPILCQIPMGILLGAGILMFPNLLGGEGKENDARRALSILYRIPPSSSAITSQIEEIKNHIKTERMIAESTSWFQIYQKKQIRRTCTSALIMVGMSITGIQFVQPYATTFLRGVGISNPYLINVIIGLCILGGSCLGPFAVEYGGRRLSILGGYSAMAACMLTLSSVSTALGPKGTSKLVIVVLLSLWSFVFGGTIAPSAGLASVEMHSVSLRTYGQANTTILYGLFSFGATFWTPYMLDPDHGNMGPNVGYFYAAVTVVIACLVFVLVPETAALTLEQIDGVFNLGVRPWKTSMAENKAIARARIQALSGE